MESYTQTQDPKIKNIIDTFTTSKIRPVYSLDLYQHGKYMATFYFLFKPEDGVFNIIDAVWDDEDKPMVYIDWEDFEGNPIMHHLKTTEARFFEQLRGITNTKSDGSKRQLQPKDLIASMFLDRVVEESTANPSPEAINEEIPIKD